MDDDPHWRELPRERRVVIVSHAGVSGVALAHLIGLPQVPWAWERFRLGHAAVAVVRTAAIADGLPIPPPGGGGDDTPPPEDADSSGRVGLPPCALLGMLGCEVRPVGGFGMPCCGHCAVQTQVHCSVTDDPEEDPLGGWIWDYTCRLDNQECQNTEQCVKKGRPAPLPNPDCPT